MVGCRALISHEMQPSTSRLCSAFEAFETRDPSTNNAAGELEGADNYSMVMQSSAVNAVVVQDMLPCCAGMHIVFHQQP